jgi:PAS domain S-box-containing protein
VLLGVVSSLTDVTERKKAEEALKEEKNKAQRYFDIAGVVLVVIDSDQRVSLINKKGCEILGFKEKEIVGRNWFDLFVPERARAEVKTAFRKLMAGKIEPVKYFENPVLTKSGEERIIAWHNTVLRDKKGKTIGSLSSGEDITERKETEKALREALERSRQSETEISELLKAAEAVFKYQNFEDSARAMFDACRDLIGARAGYIALLSKDGTRNEVMYLESGGYPCAVDLSLPMPIRGLRARAYRTAKTVYDNNFSRSKWTKYLPKGHTKLRCVLFAPLVIEDKAVGLMGIANKPGGFTDDDARMASAFAEIAALSLSNSRLLDSLRDSEERFRSVAQSATDAIISIDSRGKIIFWNQAAESIFGYRANETFGEELTLIIPTALRKAHLKGVDRVASTGKSKIIGKTVEITGLRKDGQKFPVELSLSSWELGGRLFFTGIVRDITGRKRIEEEREGLLERIGQEWGRAEELARNLKRERDTLQVTMENTEAHLAFLDAKFNFIMVNSTYAAGSGHSAEELIGRNHFELFPDAENQVIFEKVRDTGEALEFKAKPFEYVDQPWRGVTYWDWTLTPIKGESGSAWGLVLSLIDVTESTRKKRLSDALNSINETIHSTFDLERIMPEVIAASTQAMGSESGLILMREESHWVVRHLSGLPQNLVGRQFSGEEAESSKIASKTKEPVICDDVCNDKRFHGEIMKKYKVRSFLTVPLVVKDEVIGTLSFNYHSAPVTFSEAQNDFARKLGSSLSLALANARIFEAEHRIAETLQESLIRPVPKLEGLEVVVSYETASEAARVGGDFYDIFTLGKNLVAILIGDVAGKGVEAAGTTEMIRSSVRALAYIDPSPSFVLSKTNQALLAQTEPEDFATALLLVLNMATREIGVACAGHPPPILCGRQSESLNIPIGFPLGLFAETYKESYLKLKKEECVVLYTDGLTEARRDLRFFGEKGVLRALSSVPAKEPREIVDCLLKSVKDFSEGKLKDDIALVAFCLSKKK